MEPLVGGGASGGLRTFASSSHLIITDTAGQLRKIKKIIDQLDRPGAVRVIEVLPLKHAAAKNVGRQLMIALGGLESSGKKLQRHVRQLTEGGGALPVDIVIVPAAHANSLVVAGTPRAIVELKGLVHELDVPARSEEGRLHVIFLKHLSPRMRPKA